MAENFTYDPEAYGCDGLISQVRRRVGDTRNDDQRKQAYLEDEEIVRMLSDYSDSVPHAALAACRHIVARLSRETDTSAANYNTSRSQRIRHFQDLEKQRMHEVALLAQPTLSGASVSEREAERCDPDVIQPSFSVGGLH